jgi:hypothetical protein
MEMVYILCNGDLLRTKEVFELDALEFLFKAQYLLRKRKIEEVKPKSQVI